MPAPDRDLGHIKGPVYIPGVFAVRLWWELPNGKTAFNVLHAKDISAGELSQAFANTLFTAIKAQLTSSGLLAALDTETRLAKVGVRDMTESSIGFGYSEVTSNATGLAGTASGGSPLPYQIAFVVSLKTGYSRQANRGRVYLPGFNTGAQDTEGKCQETVADNAVEFVDGIKSAMTAQGMQMCIAHPARAGYEGRTGVVYDPRVAGSVEVTSISWLNLTWDTQRLRSHI